MRSPAENRSSALPDLPTFREAGYLQVVSEPWFAMFAPAGIPMAIRKRLADEIRGSTPEELGAAMKEEYDRWGPLRHPGLISMDCRRG